jgi:UV excision repair protein RAD23
MAGMAHGGQGGGGHHGGGQQLPPGSISVTPAEMESINNLVQLGFTKERAAEAFFACDKNEEMAANFLFEAGMMDEDQATQTAIAASQAEAQA